MASATRPVLALSGGSVILTHMSEVIDFPDRSTARARVAAEVRAEMARAAVSQLKLAAITGIPQSTLNRRLKPKVQRDSFTVEELDRIAHALHIGIEKFFRAYESPTPLPPKDLSTGMYPHRRRPADIIPIRGARFELAEAG
jgi:transcriptional regulator with XRE-family HTH domain